MIDPPTSREVVLAIALALVGFVMLDMVDQKDAEIARMKSAFSGCQPHAPREISVVTVLSDGTYQCALHTGKHGNRRIVYRYEYGPSEKWY